MRPSLEQRRARGICIMAGCGKPVTSEHWRCLECRRWEAIEQAARRARKQAGKKKIDRRRKEYRRAA